MLAHEREHTEAQKLDQPNLQQLDPTSSARALCWRSVFAASRRMLALSLCSTGFTPRSTLGRPLDAISIGAEVATLPCHSPCATARRATIGCRAPPPVLSFDESAYEEDRLARDAEAMAAMAVEEAKAAEDAKYAVLRNPWKWVIRRRIWDLMEAEDYAC